MNRIDFTQAGGYRLETESLSRLQGNYKIFEALGDLVGDKSIIRGCTQVGTTVSDGVIYVNGELLDFVGGQVQTKIIIIEEVTDLLFEDGENKPTFYKRYARFGSGIDDMLWSEFKRADTITYIMQNIDNIEEALLEKASVAETLAGVDDVKVSTPLGVKTAIDASTTGMLKSLRKATYDIGNPAIDQDYVIPFPTIGTNNYMVVGTIESFSDDGGGMSGGNIDNDIIWVVRELASTSFKLSIREVAASTQNIKFKYMLIQF